MDGLGLARGSIDRLFSHAVSLCRAPGGAPPRLGGGGVVKWIGESRTDLVGLGREAGTGSASSADGGGVAGLGRGVVGLGLRGLAAVVVTARHLPRLQRLNG
jgi:hypothetical protein